MDPEVTDPRQLVTVKAFTPTLVHHDLFVKVVKTLVGEENIVDQQVVGPLGADPRKRTFTVVTVALSQEQLSKWIGVCYDVVD